MSSTATETITDPGEEVLPLDFIARQVFRMEMVSTERKLAGLVTRGQRLGAPHSVLLQIKGHKCDKDCPEPPELRRKVEKRCALAHAVFNAPEPNACSDILSAPGIVRMEDPPVEDGVMDCVMRVERIIDKDYSEGKKSKLASVPSLLWRIRSLLRTYTDGLIHARKSPDLAFCDFELLYDVAFPLHHIGMLLQLDPPRFQDLLTTCGLEMDLLVLDEPLDIGAARLMAMENESIEPFSVDTLADHFSQLEIAPSNQDAAEMGGRDIPAYATVLFYGNLLMAYLLLPPDTEDNKRRRAKAMSRIVQWSSSMVLPQVIKDALADCIRPIYWDQALCREFCLKGGLSAIVRHLRVPQVDEIAHFALWEQLRQSEWLLPVLDWDAKGLFNLTEAIATLSERTETMDGAPIFLNRNVGFHTMKELCFKIFHTYGIAPFKRKYKNRKWSDPITLYYISKRIETENLRLQTREDWHSLLGDFLLLRADTERQWKWSNLSSAGLWDCIENYGCANSNCKEMKALIMVRDFNKKGSREPPAAVEERLRGWGEKLKGCTSCRLVVYCCRECQQTAWPTHKTQCKEEKRRREMWTKYRDETKVTDA